jgi:hypothetical protein
MDAQLPCQNHWAKVHMLHSMSNTIPVAMPTCQGRMQMQELSLTASCAEWCAMHDLGGCMS